MNARRAPNGSSIVFGEGDQRWMCYDPGSRVVAEANWQARYRGDAGKLSSALTLASVVSAFDYFVNVCPTTKLACEKLAQLRAAVRALPDVDGEAPTQPGATAACGRCGGTGLYVRPSPSTTFGPAMTCPYCRGRAPGTADTGAK